MPEITNSTGGWSKAEFIKRAYEALQADDGMEFDELWREASADEIAEYGTGEEA